MKVHGPFHWGEDGGAIYAEVEGVDRRVASVPLPYWIAETDREAAKAARKELADVFVAAPDLLKAAKAMFEEGAHGFDLLRAAIDKAEGK